MPLRYQPWQWIAFLAFAAFAGYVALEPIVAADDCISIAEILVLLPYYALLYFGTLPALVALAVWRIVKARTVTAQRRRDLNVTIGLLGILLVLEVLAYVSSPYLTLANRCLDFVPAMVLVLWTIRIWLSWRAPRGAHA